MMRFRGLPTSPSASPTRSADSSQSPSRGRLLDTSAFRWAIFFIALVVILFLPYTLAARLLKTMRFLNVQPMDMSRYCQRRYSNSTLELGDGSYFIALNLHNSDKVVPYIIPQIQRLVDILGSQRVFVSIYESGSVDSTGRWILLYRQYLQSNDIPHEIISDNRVRGRSQHRIDYLATVRNTVMAPLYTGKFKADFVVFINDYFCAEDVSRLAQRVRLGNDVSMACGLDIAADRFRDILFYDTWVCRDMVGGSLHGKFPFFNRKSDIERIRQGLPVPVYACWNGLVVIDASVFSKIRFRSAPGDACLSSECTLFCQDVWEVAPGNILIDPAVYVVYEQYTAERMLQYPVEGLGLTDLPVLGTFPDHEPRPTAYGCYPMVGLDSFSSPRRRVPEPATRLPNSFWFNEKLYVSDNDFVPYF